MQELLLQLEFRLPKFGANGEFGSEIKATIKTFQKKARVRQDGIYGSETHKALMDAVADDNNGKAPPEVDEPGTVTPAAEQVRIVCSNSSVSIRIGNDAKSPPSRTARPLSG